jgi:hypothetical protein
VSTMAHKMYTTAIVLAAALASSSVYAGDAPASMGDYIVELHCGKPIALTDAFAAALYSKAVQFVMSAEQNSNDARWNFPPSEVRQEYREALASDYVRVLMTKPVRIATRGGDVHALQIVIRISPHSPDGRFQYADHFTDALFTVDENGKAVGYALYAGVAAYRLFAVVADIPNHSCRIPPRAELQRVLGGAHP